jgi:broad specificity phosphatase PhoE
MDLLLVRHAQPEWDRDDVSSVDPGLTRTGTQQAELLAERMLHEHIDLLLVSTARRAQETARPVRARQSGVPTEDRAWMHEIHMPAHWDGTPADEVNRALRDARRRPRDLWWEGMPGGESFRDFHARVTIGLTAELEELGVVRRPDGLWDVPSDVPELTMVAHAGTNSVVLGHLLGLEPEPWEWERFASDHASVTRLRSTPIAGAHIFSLQTFSDVSHLPPPMVTA